MSGDQDRKLNRTQVLALRGLRVPRPTLRKLRDYGIHCEPAVSKAGHGILSGYESGGAAGALGAYCSYCLPSGEQLTWNRSLESSVSRNGTHSVVVASDFVRIQVLRVDHNFEILITRHTVEGPDDTLVSTILLRAHGMLQKSNQTEAEQRTASAPSFRNEAGVAMEIPANFKEAVCRVIAGASCIGCRHSHLLREPFAGGNGFEGELPSIEVILADLATSGWMKQALLAALSRDPVDAANDAELLYRLLDRRCRQILESDVRESNRAEHGA